MLQQPQNGPAGSLLPLLKLQGLIVFTESGNFSPQLQRRVDSSVETRWWASSLTLKQTLPYFQVPSLISFDPQRPNQFPTCVWILAFYIQNDVLKTRD